jgi:esterase/lipase
MLYDKILQGWLSIGIVGLLVGGTFAAKSVFLVDNDLEAKTEFNIKDWRIDNKSLHKYAYEVEKLAYNYVERLSKLPEQKAWCSSAQEISLVLAKAKNLQLIEVNNFTKGKADILVKLPNQNPPIKNLHLYIAPQSRENNPKQQNETWCIASGLSKQ